MTFQASARTRCSSIQIFDDLHGHLPLFRCLALYAICTATTEEMTVRRKKTMLLDRQKSAAVLRLLRGLASAGTKLAALADALSANSTVQSSSLNFNRIQTPSIPHVSGCTNILAPTRTRLLRWPRVQSRRALGFAGKRMYSRCRCPQVRGGALHEGSSCLLRRQRDGDHIMLEQERPLRARGARSPRLEPAPSLKCTARNAALRPLECADQQSSSRSTSIRALPEVNGTKTA